MDVSAIPLKGWLVRRQGDRELLSAALGGDPVAFAEVYRRYNTRIHGFCLARLGDREAAADVTQEVFIRALRSESTDIENPAAWLYAIARNAVVDAQRAAMRRPVPSEIDEGAATVNGLALAGTHEVVESGQDVDSVLLAMRAIAPRYRTTIIMRDIKGLSSADAADALRTSTGALDTLLHRARRALAKEHGRLETLPPACLRANELLHAVDPGSVSLSDAQSLEVHLLGCEDCRRERSRIRRRRTLQALLPFAFPLERSADAISRVALVGAHPILRIAAAGLAVAAVVAVPVQLAPRFQSDGHPPLRAPMVVARSRTVSLPEHDVTARLTAPRGSAGGMFRSDAGRLSTVSPMSSVPAGPAGRVGLALRSQRRTAAAMGARPSAGDAGSTSTRMEPGPRVPGSGGMTAQSGPGGR